MKRITILALVVFSLGGVPAAAAPDLKGKTLQQVFNELLPGMGAADPGARREPQQAWQAICLQLGAPGNEAQRLEACRLMVEKLNPQTPVPAREWLLRQLEHIGRGESVTAVATLLTDPDHLVRAAAIRCLAGNPAPEATTRLMAFKPDMSDAHQTDHLAVLNALGQRRDAAAIPHLAKELQGSEAKVTSAAARALGSIGTPQATSVLVSAHGKAEGPVRAAIDDALLRCADRRLQDGGNAEAAVIYRKLNQPQEPAPIRLAALRGTLRTSGDQAGALVLDLLSGSDARAKAMAIGQIPDLSPGALKVVAAKLDKLPPVVQVTVFGALAARGDHSQMPVALAALKSGDENVRQAALRALGRLGDATVEPLLLETIFTNPKLASAARESLVRLAGPGVDDQLIVLLRSEPDNRKRGELITLVETRKAAAAVPVLLQIAGGSSAELRTRALAALRQLAGPQEAPALIALLLRASSDSQREEIRQTVAGVCSLIPESGKRAEPVLAAYRGASKAEQATLLPVLGKLGGPAALVEVRAGLASKDAALTEAATRALLAWPDVTASPDLLRLAQDAGDDGRRKDAVRALIRVNTVLDEATAVQRLASLKKAMELASSPQERKLVFDGVATVRHIDALGFVLPYLEDKQLNQLACKAVVELAHSKKLREPNRAAFEPALDRVIAICRNRALVERAQRYKEGN
jgi:HEAT repeat protein